MARKQLLNTARPLALSGGPAGLLDVLAPLRLFSCALTNSDIRHLHSRPLTLLPAPGDGAAYVVVLSAYQIVTVGASFNNGQGGLYYGDTDVVADGGADATPFAYGGDIVLPLTPMVGNAGVAVTPSVDNMPIVLKHLGADMAAGGGYGRITILYYLMSLQLTPPI